MAIEKFRTRIFLTSNLTVTGSLTVSGATTNSGAQTFSGSVSAATVTVSSKLVAPYTTSFIGSTTLTDNGQILVGGTQRLYFKTGGTTYFINISGTIG